MKGIFSRIISLVLVTGMFMSMLGINVNATTPNDSVRLEAIIVVRHDDGTITSVHNIIDEFSVNKVGVTELEVVFELQDEYAGMPMYITAVTGSDVMGYHYHVNGEQVCDVSNIIRLEKGENFINLAFLNGSGSVYRNYGITFFVGTKETWSNPFSDVEKPSWYYNAIRICNQNGIMNGVSASKFEPMGTATRAMIVTALYRMVGCPKVGNETIEFVDVESGTWYYDAVKWAATSGIVNGIGDGKFAPNDDITREQLVTILYRMAKQQDKEIISNKELRREFGDFGEVSDYALEAMYWGLNFNNGIIFNRKGEELSPTKAANRAEIAAGFAAYVRNLKEN